MSGQQYLSIVEPITITDSIFQDSDVLEDDYAAWNSGTTYATGNRVILTSTHKVYESLQNGNTNKNPTTETLWWVEVGPTNRWKLFDTSVSTQTIQTGSPSNTFYYELELAEAANCLAALNLTDCDQIEIFMTSPSAGSPGIVYDETIDLSSFPLFPLWWNWFFGTRRKPDQYIAYDLPTYPDATIRVTFSGGSGLAVGVLMFGQEIRFGLGIRYGARVGIQDYSIKETNEFGDTVLLQRSFAKRAQFDMLLEKYETDIMQSFLTGIRAVPVLWVGSTEYDSTAIFGFYKNFEILLSYPEHSECELEIEGLT